MEVSQSTKQYLSQVSERAQDYHEALEFARDFVLDHQVADNRSVIDCLLMSILWCASKRDDELTEEDVCMFLNVDAEVSKGDISVELVPELKGWSLEEILTYVNGSYGTL